MSNPVGWFEIYVDNMPRAQAFYEAVLQIKLDKLDMPNIEMLTFSMDQKEYGASGSLVKMDGFPAGGNGTLVYFQSQDCSIEESRVVAAGGSIIKPKESIGSYGFISLVTDTEGNMVGIHSQA